jgi:hypothetical protein
LSYDTSKTRGYLKSFGVSVSLFEEEMLKLIEEPTMKILGGFWRRR